MSNRCKWMRIRAKGRQLSAWMGMAIDATSRLWMAGVVSARRDRGVADRLLHQVRACCQARHALLICTDGWAPYPKSIMRAFRDKVKKTAGRGRARLEVWPDLCIATVIKRAVKKRVVEVTRKLSWGTLTQAQQLREAKRIWQEAEKVINSPHTFYYEYISEIEESEK